MRDNEKNLIAFPFSQRQASVSDNMGSRQCKCKEAAVERAVAKEGPNKGRLFWVCSKLQDAKCDFFEWADEPPRNAGGGGNFSVGGSQAGPSSGECYKVFY